MRKNSESGGASQKGGAGPTNDPLSAVDADGDLWVDMVRSAEAPRPLGKIGSYEVLSEVRGGQGIVFRARQEHTGRVVALKRPAAGTLTGAAERRRFEREVEMAASLSHPGIVSVLGVELDGDVPLLAMEWVDGEEVTAWAARLPQGRQGLKQKLELFLRITAAVQHAHQRGVIHRDLKPSNVLVDAGGAPRVLDFGLARRMVAGEDELEATRTIGFYGTPAYAAPERFTDGEAPVDARGDVWSLGVLLFEILTGRRPFESPTLRGLMQAIAEVDPPRPSSLAPEIDRDLDAIVLKALAKTPEERYATVHAFADDLLRLGSGLPVLAVAPGGVYVLRKWIRRHRIESALGAALVLSLLGALGTSLWQAQRLAKERDRANAESTRASTALKEVDAARERTELALADAEAEVQKSTRLRDFYLDALFQPFISGTPEERPHALNQVRKAVAMAPEALQEFPILGAEFLSKASHALVGAGEFQEGFEVAERGLNWVPNAPSEALLIVADLEVVQAYAQIGLMRGDLARPHAERAVSIYDESDAAHRPGGYGRAHCVLGNLERSANELEPAVLNLERGLDSLARAEVNPHTLIDERFAYGVLLGITLRDMERFAEAQVALEKALALIDEGAEGLSPGAIEHLPGLFVALANAYGEQGQLTEIAPLYKRAIPLVERHQPHVLPDVGVHVLNGARQLATLYPEGSLVLYDLVQETGIDEALLQEAAKERAALQAKNP